jgi:hypothetical protein
MRGNVPWYRDLSSVHRWQTFVARVLDDLARLVDSAAFTLTTREDVTTLREWASRRAVLDQFRIKVRTIHGDAIRGNVFVTSQGVKLIDWQRPLPAPAEIDIVSLLESMDFSPIGSVDPAIIGIFHFTRLAWTVECQITWIPGGTCCDSWVSDHTRAIVTTCG